MELFKKLISGYIDKRMTETKDNEKNIGALSIDFDKCEAIFRDIYNKHVKSVSLF